jgi:hydrogenase maturation protease
MSGPVRVVVAGWGNPLRGDDGAGRWVADSIAARWFDSLSLWERARGRVAPQTDYPGVEARWLVVLSDQHPLPEWAPILAEADVAILVDATSDPDVTDVRITRMDPTTLQVVTSGHAFGAREVLALAASLYGRQPEAFLVEIPSSTFDFIDGSSPSTERAAAKAVRWIDYYLTGALQPQSPSLFATRGERESEPARTIGACKCTKLD